MSNIFFINTPVDIQDEIYDTISEQLKRYNIPENKIIYLRFTPIASIYGKFCFSVYIKDTIIDHALLDYSPDFLIFNK